MALFTVDTEKCNRDGICAAECPIKIIATGDDGVPYPVNGADALCIDCGHCVAVCPTAALSHKNLAPEDCLSVNKEWVPEPVATEHFLRYRRSIRTYKEDPVDRKILEKLIHVARYAPSGHNTQPVKWQVIYDRADVIRLSEYVIDWMRHMIKKSPDFASALHLDLVVGGWEFGMDTISRGAPHLILANAPTANPASQNASIIAMTYLELAVPAFGLGACWNGFFNAAATYWQPLQKALELEDGDANFAAMMVGHSRFKYHRMPERKAPEIKWT